MRKLFAGIIAILILVTPVEAHAFIPLSAPSAILTDENTGTVLYAHNVHDRMYPAGLTKMLTALAALDYLDPEQIVVIGTEIYNVPAGALRSGHQSGEHITVHNLLRGLMIQNGNDSAATLAVQTVQAQRNNNNVPYTSAMQIFSDMMNERARELGAQNSNFVNPGGLHNDNHYSTAYDLARIARAYMAHPILREIAEEAEFIGNSLYGYQGDISAFHDVRTIDHHWTDSNELITGGTFHFQYATGIRAGATPQAGSCLAATAERRGVRLISVVMGTEDPGRWQDARMLFDYGFATYEYHNILENGQHLNTVVVSGAKLGGESILDVLVYGDFTALLSQTQIAQLQRVVVFDDEFIAYEEDGNITLMAPIGSDEVLGSITYTLDGQVVFEGELRAAIAIEERTLDSDMDFYIALVRDNIFSIRAIPFWMGSAGLLVGVVGTSLAIAERRRSKRSWYGRR